MRKKKPSHKCQFRVHESYHNGVQFKCRICGTSLSVHRRGLWAMFVWGFPWTKTYRTRTLWRNDGEKAEPYYG